MSGVIVAGLSWAIPVDRFACDRTILVSWIFYELASTNNPSTAVQTYISSLEVALRDEMLQHAPLYGVGLDEMSADELEALTKIHKEGLRTIEALKQQKVIARRNPMMSHLGTSTAAVLPPPVSDGDVLHRNGHVNGSDLPPLNYR